MTCKLLLNDLPTAQECHGYGISGTDMKLFRLFR